MLDGEQIKKAKLSKINTFFLEFCHVQTENNKLRPNLHFLLINYYVNRY